MMARSIVPIRVVAGPSATAAQCLRPGSVQPALRSEESLQDGDFGADVVKVEDPGRGDPMLV